MHFKGFLKRAASFEGKERERKWLSDEREKKRERERESWRVGEREREREREREKSEKVSYPLWEEREREGGF
jgi:hypothetical protein